MWRFHNNEIAVPATAVASLPARGYRLRCLFHRLYFHHWATCILSLLVVVMATSSLSIASGHLPPSFAGQSSSIVPHCASGRRHGLPLGIAGAAAASSRAISCGPACCAPSPLQPVAPLSLSLVCWCGLLHAYCCCCLLLPDWRLVLPSSPIRGGHSPATPKLLFVVASVSIWGE